MNTKILATVGPASLEKIKKLQEKGASRFRLNLSHGDVDFHKNAICKIKEIGNPNEVVLDTKGPDIRTGDTDGEIKILKGEEYFLIFSDKKEKIFSDDKKIFHGFKKFSETVEIGDKIIIDDGKIVLTVSEKGENLKAIAKNFGTITSRRHINLPGKHIDLPILTKSDEEILKMGISEGIDAVAVSFVRNK